MPCGAHRSPAAAKESEIVDSDGFARDVAPQDVLYPYLQLAQLHRIAWIRLFGDWAAYQGVGDQNSHNYDWGVPWVLFTVTLVDQLERQERRRQPCKAAS